MPLEEKTALSPLRRTSEDEKKSASSVDGDAKPEEAKG